MPKSSQPILLKFVCDFGYTEATAHVLIADFVDQKYIGYIVNVSVIGHQNHKIHAIAISNSEKVREVETDL